MALLIEYCPDYGPDTGHHYRDEDTGEYRCICACGQLDPYYPFDQPSPLIPTGDDQPPF